MLVYVIKEFGELLYVRLLNSNPDDLAQQYGMIPKQCLVVNFSRPMLFNPQLEAAKRRKSQITAL